MRRWMVAARSGVVIGVVLGCATEGDPPTPQHGDACDDGEPARCGQAEGGTTAPKNAVLVCDGATWSTALQCGALSDCSDDDERGAVLCEAGDEPAIVYGEHTGSCDVADAQACSFERDYVLVCDGGTWNIATNCSTEVLRCALQGSDFVCA